MHSFFLHFSAHFIFGLAHFFLGFLKNFAYFCPNFQNKSGQKPKSGHKSGREKSPKLLGFLEFCPLSHFFS